MNNEDLKFWEESKEVEKGIIPKSFIYKINCRRCGIVPMDFVASGIQDWCPWCFVSERTNVNNWKEQHGHNNK